ncbi:hypothetical protein SISNIDRAFT_330760 [Sistotremastrum niveocremeum HHB9708]|uniref:Uncharacterized protein n=1 Tax=Sistotremastrum niveocremeum HHB9708 TaxID=1314777 RepID=A0A164XG44_9AGAM|nr:hypothetical protein SISNIDRAFT_330760 [Sistotremastrum niveocremeum HHB9708]
MCWVSDSGTGQSEALASPVLRCPPLCREPSESRCDPLPSLACLAGLPVLGRNPQWLPDIMCWVSDSGTGHNEASASCVLHCPPLCGEPSESLPNPHLSLDYQTSADVITPARSQKLVIFLVWGCPLHLLDSSVSHLLCFLSSSLCISRARLFHQHRLDGRPLSHCRSFKRIGRVRRSYIDSHVHE